MIADKRLGRKNGRGFYRYHDGQKTGVDTTVYRLLGVRPQERHSPTVVEQRLVYAMLNEAAMAVGEGVVRQAARRRHRRHLRHRLSAVPRGARSA